MNRKKVNDRKRDGKVSSKLGKKSAPHKSVGTDDGGEGGTSGNWGGGALNNSSVRSSSK